ncbi:MAG: flippase-like domain-containing protein [Chloroflexi bacterium]|nr:flippase-like domain-containing protein [Chloroflexota bacterium]
MNPRNRFWVGLLWLGALALLAWAVSRLSLGDVAAAIRRLTGGQLALLALANIGIMALFGLRWWAILRAQGHAIRFRAILRYRLAAFGVSYFTPGPHFGGEPLQVYYIHRNHGVPLADAAAAISLDKLFEMTANFTFLLAGVVVVATSGLLGSAALRQAAPILAVLFCLPVLYGLALWRGRQPLTAMLGRFAGDGPSRPWVFRLSRFMGQMEAHMADFSRGQPRAMLAALGISGVVWAALVFEFWLMTGFLGVDSDIIGLVTMMTAARLALLTPFPGALGALEAGQMLALTALGYGPETGAAISLLIRGRDVLFGLAGLAWGGLFKPGFFGWRPE